MQGWKFALVTGWLRHAGWRNVHWRDDTMMDYCIHRTLMYDELLNEHDHHQIAICVDCGKIIRL